MDSHTSDFLYSCSVRPLCATYIDVCLLACSIAHQFGKIAELEQFCAGLCVGSTAVQACHTPDESTTQDIDPTGGSEKSTMMNEVCTVTVSRK